ncbi:MAG: hypothetical protein R3F19_31910 [Verrucomicrobiales bacterium]
MIPKEDPARKPLKELRKQAEELEIIRSTRRTVHPDGSGWTPTAYTP